MQELLKAGAFQLATMIRKGKVSPREVVDAHIARVEEVNPKLNAMVADRFEAARKEADEATEALTTTAPEDLPPLHGIPFTIKETIALAGLPQTSGSIHHKHRIPQEDATAVRRLRDAGAIPIGVSNVPEMAMWFETFNKVYGTTNNPYNLDCTPGGSSGGEAALVGAGASPFGIGSDIGGSIRLPAMFCGVYGHKPTGGTVPMTGSEPASSGDVGRYVTTGPLARRATDLMPLLQLMAGADGKDQQVIDFDLQNPDIDFKGRKVYLCESINTRLTPKTEHEQRLAVTRAGLIFSGRGAPVEAWSSPKLKEAELIWGSMLAEANNDGTFGELLGGGTAPNYMMEIGKLALGISDYTLPSIIFALAETVMDRFKADRTQMVKLGLELRQEVQELLGEDAILIAPTHPRPAPKHRATLLRPFDFIHAAIFNIMEIPVTAAPMGLGSARLPLGVQIAAGHKQDHISIAAAVALERETGGWQIPITSLMDNPPGSLR